MCIGAQDKGMRAVQHKFLALHIQVLGYRGHHHLSGGALTCANLTEVIGFTAVFKELDGVGYGQASGCGGSAIENQHELSQSA